MRGEKGYNRYATMEFLTEHWGNAASVAGVVVSTVGLIWAIVVARGARSASRAAQKAAQETGFRIAQHLQATTLERSIALIQRLKLLHRLGSWEAALEQYQALRMMLNEIVARLPQGEAESRRMLVTAIRAIRDMENLVERQPDLRPGPENISRLNRRLNRIQSELESLVGAPGFGDPQEEPT